MPPRPAKHKRLQEIHAALPEAEQGQLLAFAEFLMQRSGARREAELPTEPLSLPRPRQESLVAAIKRLRSTYPMLQAEQLLDETSSLMTQHMMQGREAEAVIDELEALFARHFTAWSESRT